MIWWVTYVKTGRISKNWTWSAFHFSNWAPNSGRKNMLGNLLFNYSPKEMELVFAVPWSSSKMNSLVHCNNTYGSMNFPKMNSQLTITICMVLWSSKKTELIEKLNSLFIVTITIVPWSSSKSMNFTVHHINTLLLPGEHYSKCGSKWKLHSSVFSSLEGRAHNGTCPWIYG
jgi:hypothetical protein